MRDLYNAMPHPDILLALSPEELGGKILFSMLRAKDQPNCFGYDYALLQLYPRSHPDGAYPGETENEVTFAVMEAWSWMEATGLIMPAPGPNGTNGYKVLTRRAKRFQDKQEFAGFIASRQLPRELIHLSIAEPVWHAFIREDYDVAVFKAMKAVEISVREACNYKDTERGVPMMRKAFNPESGPLTDIQMPIAEQQALAALFAGATGRYKNPQSHHEVGLDDPILAIEIILLASHLLGIIDARRPSN